MMTGPGLYIHIPFCEVKCGYCDFFSVPRGYEDFDLQKNYVDQLCHEIRSRRHEHHHVSSKRPLGSIFFGGGTPSLLDPKLLEKILSELSPFFVWDDKTEVTLETNPKTVSLNKLRAFRSLGINRISLGVQSFNDDLLKTMGRIHTGEEARKTIGEIRKAGFENFSMDLIFALPGQTLSMWQEDMMRALSFESPHLSCYHLTLEGGTPFERLYGEKSRHNSFRERLPSEEDGIRCLAWTRETLAGAGLPAYEISNFARPGFESVHNRNYWRYGEYLGFGTSAASFLKATTMEEGIFGRRSSNVRDLKRYLDGAWGDLDETLSFKQAMGEYCWLGLRTREGLSRNLFHQEFGRTLDSLYRSVLEDQVRQNRIIDDGLSIRLTEDGLLYADSVACLFFP